MHNHNHFLMQRERDVTLDHEKSEGGLVCVMERVRMGGYKRKGGVDEWEGYERVRGV